MKGQCPYIGANAATRSISNPLYLSLEATAFYDRYMGLVPTTEQVSRVLPEEGSYQKVQEAYGHYRQEDDLR
jgi:hypothetical protein